MINLDPFSLAANNLKEAAILACKDGGVTYGSHGADYAEYIEKTDHAEYIQGFDVVGIKGGMVSRNTEGAEQIMIVSTKPVVLGNTPKESEEKIMSLVVLWVSCLVWFVGCVIKEISSWPPV